MTLCLFFTATKRAKTREKSEKFNRNRNRGQCSGFFQETRKYVRERRDKSGMTKRKRRGVLVGLVNVRRFFSQYDHSSVVFPLSFSRYKNDSKIDFGCDFLTHVNKSVQIRQVMLLSSLIILHKPASSSCFHLD